MRTPPPKHPAEFSREIETVLVADILGASMPTRVHDPFAGRGVKLGALCDRLGITFSGTDIECWANMDPRVRRADATDPDSYPTDEFTIVTSPVYLGNRISSDYVNGPTPSTKVNGRRSYGISLRDALHRDNLARLCRPKDADLYYEEHGRAVKHWPAVAIVNIDAPIAAGWSDLLIAHGYRIDAVHEVVTRRYRGPANSDKRAPHEVVLVANQERNTP